MACSTRQRWRYRGGGRGGGGPRGVGAAIQGGEAAGMESLEVGHVDPGAAPIGRLAGAERHEREARIPGTPAEADRATLLEPAPLLPGERGDAGPAAG